MILRLLALFSLLVAPLAAGEALRRPPCPITLASFTELFPEQKSSIRADEGSRENDEAYLYEYRWPGTPEESRRSDFLLFFQVVALPTVAEAKTHAWNVVQDLRKASEGPDGLRFEDFAHAPLWNPLEKIWVVRDGDRFSDIQYLGAEGSLVINVRLYKRGLDKEGLERSLKRIGEHCECIKKFQSLFRPLPKKKKP
jgi:hypothetical protein